MSFVLGENRYTVVYLDKPTNPKPAEYNERTYGRFGSFFRYELDEGQDLEVNYRIWLQDGELTAQQAEALSRDLRRRGFRFVGPTICYAFMQAVGMVNDHLVTCPARRAVNTRSS